MYTSLEISPIDNNGASMAIILHRHTFLGVSPIDNHGTYIWVVLRRIVPSVCKY